MAQLFAALHPERVERLLLVNSSPGASGFVELHTDADGSTARLLEKLEMFGRLEETWGRDPRVHGRLVQPGSIVGAGVRPLGGAAPASVGDPRRHPPSGREPRPARCRRPAR